MQANKLVNQCNYISQFLLTTDLERKSTGIDFVIFDVPACPLLIMRRVSTPAIIEQAELKNISHVFSYRLSSMPMGWSRNGADKIAQLRIFKKNGGKVYDLVMAQKKREKTEKEHEMQDELIKGLKKTNGNRYLNSWNSNITVLEKGHKTALYNSLRKISSLLNRD